MDSNSSSTNGVPRTRCRIALALSGCPSSTSEFGVLGRKMPPGKRHPYLQLEVVILAEECEQREELTQLAQLEVLTVRIGSVLYQGSRLLRMEPD